MKKSLLATLGIGALVASCGATAAPSGMRPSFDDTRHQDAHAEVRPATAQYRGGYLLPEPDCPTHTSHPVLRMEVADIDRSFARPPYRQMFVTYYAPRPDTPVTAVEFRYIDETMHALTRPFAYGEIQVDYERRTLDVTVTIDEAMDCIGGNEQVQRQHADFPPGTTPVPIPRETPQII